MNTDIIASANPLDCEAQIQRGHKKQSSILRATCGILLAGLLLTGCGESPTGGTTCTIENPGQSSKTLISLVAPKGCESYKVGQTVAIKWTTKADDVDPIVAVDLEYSPDGGLNWGWIEANSIGDNSVKWLNYPWTIPDSINVAGIKTSTVSTQGMVRVKDYGTTDTTRIVLSGKITIAP